MIVAIQSILDRASQVFITIAAFFLAVMAVLGTADVLALNLFDAPIPSATEFISAMLPIAVMMAMSYTQVTRSHVSVDLFTNYFSPTLSRFLENLSLLVGIAVFGLLAWGAWRLTIHSISIDERAVAAVRFPIWPIKIIFSFGISVTSLQMLFDLLSRLTLSSGRR